MIIADIEVHSSSAIAKEHGVLTFGGGLKTHNSRPAGINESKSNLLPIGACGLKVQFHFFDSAWDNLSKTAVFRNGNVTMDAAIVDNCAAIPHEVLAKVMDVVDVGVYGTNSKQSLAIPTIWAKLGTVTSAAKPSGVSSAKPTLPYWAQIKEQVDMLHSEMMDQEDLENALIEAKERGDFDGPQGPRGEIGEAGPQGPKGETGEAGPQGVGILDISIREV